MKVIRNIDEIVKITRKIKEDGYILGMVPTMGCQSHQAGMQVHGNYYIEDRICQ